MDKTFAPKRPYPEDKRDIPYITLQPITYNQAKKLKSLGFNQYTQGSYVGREYTSYMGWNNKWKVEDPIHKFPLGKSGKIEALPMLAAPSCELAIKWFEIVHGFIIHTMMSKARELDAELDLYKKLKTYEEDQLAVIDILIEFLEDKLKTNA